MTAKETVKKTKKRERLGMENAKTRTIQDTLKYNRKFIYGE